MGPIASLLLAEEGVKKNCKHKKSGISRKEISQWKTEETIAI